MIVISDTVPIIFFRKANNLNFLKELNHTFKNEYFFNNFEIF